MLRCLSQGNLIIQVPVEPREFDPMNVYVHSLKRNIYTKRFYWRKLEFYQGQIVQYPQGDVLVAWSSLLERSLDRIRK